MSLTQRYGRFIPIDFTLIGIVPERQLHVKGVGLDAHAIAIECRLSPWPESIAVSRDLFSGGMERSSEWRWWGTDDFGNRYAQSIGSWHTEAGGRVKEISLPLIPTVSPEAKSLRIFLGIWRRSETTENVYVFDVDLLALSADFTEKQCRRLGPPLAEQPTLAQFREIGSTDWIELYDRFIPVDRAFTDIIPKRVLRILGVGLESFTGTWWSGVEEQLIRIEYSITPAIPASERFYPSRFDWYAEDDLGNKYEPCGGACGPSNDKKKLEGVLSLRAEPHYEDGWLMPGPAPHPDASSLRITVNPGGKRLCVFEVDLRVSSE